MKIISVDNPLQTAQAIGMNKKLGNIVTETDSPTQIKSHPTGLDREGAGSHFIKC